MNAKDQNPVQSKLEIVKISPSPIPKPNHLLQYRAIGLIEGIYTPSNAHFCKGAIITGDRTKIEAVVLGRVMPILQKKLNLSQPYLWVVYPRTINKTSQLYVQISGVWAPTALGKEVTEADVEDGFFSVRGEVVEQAIGRGYVVVKIKRGDRSLPRSKNKFKLKLKGVLPSNGLGYFWDFTVMRQGHNLVISSAKAIAALPKKPPKKPVIKPKLVAKPKLNYRVL